MPPLLPEYLDNPVAVVVSNSSPEWWETAASLGSPIVGLAGVAVGALLTHKLGRQQERKRTRLQKLEELSSRSRGMYTETCKFIDRIQKVAQSSVAASDDGSVYIDYASLPEASTINADINALEFLVQVHCPELNGKCSVFIDQIVGLYGGVQLDTAFKFDCFESYQAFYKGLLIDRGRALTSQIDLQQSAINEARKLS
ncbi:hypothetical protein [Halomonas sp. DWK9]|uniref:hypothetical protein n=1 Tax=Halomonas sp. DWK9 TaxID=3060155 RepID=UPI00287FEDDE|nr:hypothetical protein [Halomonas sp. DWK9]